STVAIGAGESMHRIPMPYLLLYDYFPGFSALRGPTRIDAFLFLSLSVLAAQGAACLAATGKWLRPLVAALAVGIEYWTAPLPVFEPPGPDSLPGCYAFLRSAAETPRGAAIVLTPHFRGDIGYSGWNAETRAMYLAAIHGHPVANGY